MYYVSTMKVGFGADSHTITVTPKIVLPDEYKDMAVVLAPQTFSYRSARPLLPPPRKIKAPAAVGEYHVYFVSFAPEVAAAEVE